MTPLPQWRSWIQRLGHVEKARAERRIPSGFSVRRRNNAASRPATIRDISSTGLHIVTEERWTPGELIPLIVQAERLAEDHSEPQVEVHARVVRHAHDGLGLAFVLPAGLNPELWDVLLRNAVVLQEPKDVLHTLRVLRTAMFLCRLCQDEANDAIELLGGKLDPTRTENAMEIAYGAQKLLAARPYAEKMRAHPPLVLSILKHGSWADELTRQLWVGLLATSCSLDGKDESNSEFAELLVNVTRSQCRILLSGCMKVLEARRTSGDAGPTRVILTPEQMIRLTAMYDMTRNATDVAHLFITGIVEKNFDFTSYVTTEAIDITPSRLGLELYERGKGDCVETGSTLDVWEGFSGEDAVGLSGPTAELKGQDGTAIGSESFDDVEGTDPQASPLAAVRGKDGEPEVVKGRKVAKSREEAQTVKRRSKKAR